MIITFLYTFSIYISFLRKNKNSLNSNALIKIRSLWPRVEMNKERTVVEVNYEEHRESNAIYFSILVKDVSGGYCWQCSSDWKFSPIIHISSLLKSSRATVWHNGVIPESAYEEEMHNWIAAERKHCNPSTFVEAWWTFTELKHWMWAQISGG